MTPVEQLLSNGLVSMPALSASQCGELQDALKARWRDHGCPPLYADVDQSIGERVHISPVGCTLRGVLEDVPACRELLLFPPLIQALHEALGPELVLEMGAAVIADRARPFFFWHHHIGGIDGEAQRRSGTYPVCDRIERVACTFYLSPLDHDHGAMHWLPRALREPTQPRGDVKDAAWPDARSLLAPAGSLVLIEQCTWHCVTPMTRAGTREFISFFVRRADVGATLHDPSVATALRLDERLSAHYRV